MIVKIEIIDGDASWYEVIDLSKYLAMALELRLLAIVLKSENLAKVFGKCVMIGIDSLLWEYGKLASKSQLSDFQTLWRERA